MATVTLVATRDLFIGDALIRQGQAFEWPEDKPQKYGVPVGSPVEKEKPKQADTKPEKARAVAKAKSIDPVGDGSGIL